MDEPAPRNLGVYALPAGALGGAWAAAAFGPWGLPAWPAVSLGLVAMWLSRRRGPPLLRGVGAFVGLMAAIAGSAKIAALWGLAEVLRRAAS